MPTDALLTHPAGPRHGDGMLRLIGAFKLLKGLAMVIASVAILKMLHADLANDILHWSRKLHIAPGNVHVARLVEKALTVTPNKLKVVSAVFMAYAAMFFTEGFGLMFAQPWAEWMTVITTAGLIPFEIYEFFPPHHPTVLKALALLINVVIVVYLVWHVRRQKRAARHGPMPN